MIEGWSVVALALGYVSILFAVAWYADRTARPRKPGGGGRPLVYALSLAVYCTSWTFFGSVGLAASTGYDFFPVYLGPILLFVFGWRVLLRIVRLAKSQNITSVADFLAARYGKSQAVAAIVTVIAVAGTLPYIALQLKAVALSVNALLGPGALGRLHFPADTALIIAIAMGIFAILFGTRHIDATEHQEGLIVAVAAESLVKLAAFLTVGFFVVFSVFGGIGNFFNAVSTRTELSKIFAQGLNGGTWVTVTFLSMVCIVLLPRQFHVTVVENNSERELQRASWLFPVYLILINLFVVPIAAAGLLGLPKGAFDADTFVLALPLSKGAEAITLLAFIGGLSAATAMVIVDSVALAIMVCNGLVLPLLLRHRSDESASNQQDMTRLLLTIRRVAIFAIVLLGYLFYRLLGQTHGLASIGLVSFAAIAQFAPAFFGGLIWRKATARGAIAGIVIGFAVWAYTLLLPWIIEAGWVPRSVLTEGPFGLGFLSPQALFYLRFEPLTHGVLWSMAANICAFISVSLLKAPEPVERLQAQVFVAGDMPRPPASPAFRLWRTSITVGDLQNTVSRYLGAERAERSFAEFAESRGVPLSPEAGADIQLLRFTEHLLASAIGAASSRLVLSLLLRRGDAGSQSALRLLDDASEALQYNRDLLQSALDQVRHGLSVFDKDMRLICWNRQFRELLECADGPGAGRRAARQDPALVRRARRFRTGRHRQAGGRAAGQARRVARHLPGAGRRRTPHPRDPHQPDAAGRHRHHLLRHHRSGRGGRGAGARQRDAGGPRARAHGRAAGGQQGAGGRQAQGRRGQPRQDALPGSRQPRRPAAPQCGAAVRDQHGGAAAGRARGDARPQHRCLAGSRGGDPQRADRDRAARHRPHGARPDGVPVERGAAAPGRRVRADGAQQGPRPAGGADQRLGALGPAPAAPRAAEPGLQRHQVHPGRQGSARRASPRRQRQRAGVRYRPRHPAGQALHHLQGVPAPGGDRRLGARAWARAFHRRAHRQGAAPPRAAGVDTGAWLGVLGRPAAGRGKGRRRRRPSLRRSPRVSYPASGSYASTTSRRCCMACRRC